MNKITILLACLIAITVGQTYSAFKTYEETYSSCNGGGGEPYAIPAVLNDVCMNYAKYSCNATADYIDIYSDASCTTLSTTYTQGAACERSGNDYATASCETNITDFYQQNNNYAAFVQLEWDVQTCTGTPSRIFTYRADYCALVSSNGPQYTMYTCNDTHVTLYNLCSDSACSVGCQVIASEIQPTCFQGVYQYCWAPNTSFHLRPAAPVTTTSTTASTTGSTTSSVATSSSSTTGSTTGSIATTGSTSISSTTTGTVSTTSAALNTTSGTSSASTLTIDACILLLAFMVLA